ncbi:uncharacterized protein LOC131427242 [Malaya genurostris]|uniref:uncharacterized protein LOC131427242 n=1 Tax=Malaya genurostris TaxID=325434 RepID=UPI0026F38284|nr:uncharacterized protein LOC131427242 [Malaya genurostris]
MRSLVLIAVVLCVFSVTLADRAKTREVLQKLKELHPKYKDIQDFVIKTISEAQLKTTEKVNVFHEDILTIKETFVVNTILIEEAFLEDISNKPEAEDGGECVEAVEQSSRTAIVLAGSAISKCITDVSDVLTVEVSKISNQIKKDDDFIWVDLFNSFRGGNIFSRPESILATLAEKDSRLQLPSDLYEEMSSAISTFGDILNHLQAIYIECMTDADLRLKRDVESALEHFVKACGGVINHDIVTLPSLGETNPEDESAAEISEENPEAENEELVPSEQKFDILKAYREHRGMH